MTSEIQFPGRRRWHWFAVSAILTLAAAFSVVVLGPLWAIATAVFGLLFSFAGFVQTLRFPSLHPPLWLWLLLGLAQTLTIGIGLYLYVLFVLPVLDQGPLPLTQQIEAASGRLI